MAEGKQERAHPYDRYQAIRGYPPNPGIAPLARHPQVVDGFDLHLRGRRQELHQSQKLTNSADGKAVPREP